MDALLLHGLGGGPADMDSLAQGLATLGVACHAPCLPGHGAGWEDFVHSHWSQWSAAAHEAYATLADQSLEPPLLAGYSLGGLLALDTLCWCLPRPSTGPPVPDVWANGPCAGGLPGKPGASLWRSAPRAARPPGRPRPGKGMSGWSAGVTWPR